MTERIAATVRTTMRRVDTSRPPIDRIERPSPVGRATVFFSARLSERKKRRPVPSCRFSFVTFTRFFAEASAPFEDFAAFAAALR